jgi:hypothetical protein
MNKFDCYEFYREYMVDEDKGEIPLNFKEWEREIFPKDLKFLKHISNRQK